MKKVLVHLMVFTLLFATIGTTVSYAKDDEVFNEDDYIVDYHEGVEGFDWAIYLDDSDDNGGSDNNLEEPQIEARALPFVPIVIGVVVRLVAKWVGKQAVKKISKHAAERAAQRGITERHFASAMAYGTKYVDKNTGAKILYHSPTQTTLVLDKAGDVVVTSYKQIAPKEVWITKNW
ncbi:hypothetical protein LYSIN_01804 [Lysinibacillus sphaericus]|uniref:Uncharacterized protein n=1 Tax=Lysinibacillus sphaericus TaxID=1421 RepID=A0A2S5D1U8_LYSSH|nr:hypothetical protein [Lysinibacillus sphaericus]POZ57021.1 hypothetical protein LYSIN_01804 [Lysinibacillus sphaericus]